MEKELDLLDALKLTLTELREYPNEEVKGLAEDIVMRIFLNQQARTGQKQVNGPVK